MENYKKITCLLLLIALLAGCSTQRPAPVPEVNLMPTAALEDGRVLFNNYCHQCHPGGMAGLGPAIINKPLPKFMIRFQVRHGLGVMPDFDEDVLSDGQVRRIADYLGYIKKVD